MAVPVQHARVDVPVEVVRVLGPAAPHLGVASTPAPVALKPRVPHPHTFRHGLRGQGTVRGPSDRLISPPPDVGRGLVGAGGVGGHDPATTEVGPLQREERVPEGRA